MQRHSITDKQREELSNKFIAEILFKQVLGLDIKQVPVAKRGIIAQKALDFYSRAIERYLKVKKGGRIAMQWKLAQEGKNNHFPELEENVKEAHTWVIQNITN
jgi:hypothetical protein